MEKNQINKILIIRVSELIHVVMKKIWAIVLTGVLLALVGCGVAAATKEKLMYLTTTKLYVTGVDSTVPSANDLALGKQVLNNYIEVLKSGPVLNKVIENLGLNMSAGQLKNCISINIPPETCMLEMSVVFSDGEWAKKIADELVVVSAERALEVMGCTEPIIYEEAYVPVAPYNADKLSGILYALVGGAVGVVVSGFVIVVMYFTNTKFTNPYKVTDRLRLKMLGVIPNTEYQEAAYQNFLSHVKFEDPAAKIISFVSATENEEKYEFIEKLAESLKQNGKKVVIVDTNITNPQWGAGNRVELYYKGIEAYLKGDVSLEDVIVQREGIAYIYCKEAVVNPTELLLQKQFSKLLVELKNEYDYVLVDTAPLNYVFDAICVIERTETSVMVISGNKSRVEQAKEALAILKEHNCSLLGAVLKDADISKDRVYFCKEFGKYFGVYK